MNPQIAKWELWKPVVPVYHLGYFVQGQDTSILPLPYNTYLISTHMQKLWKKKNKTKTQQDVHAAFDLYCLNMVHCILGFLGTG